MLWVENTTIGDNMTHVWPSRQITKFVKPPKDITVDGSNVNVSPSIEKNYELQTDETLTDVQSALESVFQNTQNLVWNNTLSRLEVWGECPASTTYNTGLTYLQNAWPGRKWQEKFNTGIVFVPAILGLDMELSWILNGRSNGAVAVDENNIESAQADGGGLRMLVESGGQDNDYTALSFGTYPIRTAKNPHVYLTAQFNNSSDVGYYVGLADDSISTGTGAFGVPDNGIYVRYDTDEGDTGVTWVIRIGGVDVYTKTIGAVTGTKTCGGWRPDADGNLELFFRGYSVDTYTGALPSDFMTPYFAIVARAGALASDISLDLHDLIIVTDDGF